MRKRLFLFVPLMVVLGLVNEAALVTALLSQNLWMYAGLFILLVLTLLVFYLLMSMNKSINKFYQTMEKQLSP